MLKKFLAIAALMFAASSFAAVDVNKATRAELDGIKGIGPDTAASIMSERKKGEFKDWADFSSRVKGIKEKRAAKLSEAGLTIGGASFAAPAPAKKADKAAAPAAPVAAAPVAASSPVAAKASAPVAVVPAAPVAPVAAASGAKK